MSHNGRYDNGSIAQLSDTQDDLRYALDDVAEHVHWEFDSEDYIGPSTCGMASITNIDGRSKFVRRVKGLAEKQAEVESNWLEDWPYNVDIYGDQNGVYRIEFPGLDLNLMYSDYRGCYRLSINNLGDFLEGANVQRLDGQERLHGLVLERFNENGYLTEARVTSRVD